MQSSTGKKVSVGAWREALSRERFVEHPIFQQLNDRIVDVHDCMEWVGFYCTGGHMPAVRRNRQSTSVRRIIAEALGVNVKGRRILMSCGNFRCVCPEHYKVMSSRDALRVVARMGGEANKTKTAPNPGNVKRRKLTDDQVNYIRTSDESSFVLAPKFGVSRTVITAIRRGELYRDVGATNIWSQLLRKST